MNVKVFGSPASIDDRTDAGYLVYAGLMPLSMG